MKKVLRYGLLLIVFLVTFFLSGQVGLACELHTQSVAAGVGVFGISFVGITMNAFKILTSFF
jgi:hypothetical protein